MGFLSGMPRPRNRNRLPSTTHPFSPAASQDGADYDLMLGVNGDSPQYGILGEVSGRKVALDLNHTHTISLFGVQGGGKSYTLGTIAEMASLAHAEDQPAASPLATVIFHYSPTHGLPAGVHLHGRAEQRRGPSSSVLRERYGAEPHALSDAVLLSPASKLEERRARVSGHRGSAARIFAAAELRQATGGF
jgi:DNA phosphorothioation-dependent restriction protein DptH